MRSNGILMHLSSLPSPYGIGSMGKPAHDFVDYLVEAGQSYWQMLPICPTSYGDSPYQSFSTFAGNPYFIDLEQLAADGWIEESDFKDIDWESEEDNIDSNKWNQSIKEEDRSQRYCAAKQDREEGSIGISMSLQPHTDGGVGNQSDDGNQCLEDTIVGRR